MRKGIIMDPVYAIAAESHHPANDHPKWAEGIYFFFCDPKSTVGGCMRIGLFENLKEANTWLVLFKNGKLAYNRFCAASLYTPDRMTNKGRPNGLEVAGLRFTSIEPLKKALVEYSADDVSVNLIFEASQPMADAISMTTGQNAGLKENIAAAHLEGPTRVNGTVALRGKKYDIVDCIGFRDLGWGVRDWEEMAYYVCSWPVFTNGQTIATVRAITVKGQKGYMKMLHDGKEWLAVGKIEDNIEYCEDGITVKLMHCRVWDSLDRVWEYTAKPVFHYLIPLDGFVASEHWAEYRLSDGTVGYGLLECGFRLPLE